jgi:hypothetical protein
VIRTLLIAAVLFFAGLAAGWKLARYDAEIEGRDQ